MHIGLIGGIGPAATDFSWRRLITTFAGANTPLELTIVHADAPTLLRNLAANEAQAQVAIYLRLTSALSPPVPSAWPSLPLPVIFASAL